MLRRSMAVAFLLLGLIAACATAGVPRVVVLENFGATWSGQCSYARCGCEMLQNEYSYDRLVYFEDHLSPSDPFTTGETEARGSWYGVTGYPVVRIDGNRSVAGAVSCESAALAYRVEIEARLAETGGMSPVAITGNSIVRADSVTMSATYRLMDPVHLESLRATLQLYEDNVEWCCGYGWAHTWQRVTRRIYDQSITLTNVNDSVVVTAKFPVDAGWVPDNLHGVAYLQQTTTKEMIQGLIIRDYAVDFATHLESAPNGNSMVAFHGTVQNLKGTSQDFTIEVGSPFGDWATEFLVCGDGTAHQQPLEISLAPGESCDVTFRAMTNSVREIRSGTFRVTCQASGMVDAETFRIFNESPAILLVDNDGGQSYETGLVNGLNYSGYLFDNWDVVTLGSTPPRGNMTGFDIIIWHTAGRESPSILSAADEANLMSFMDEGGSIFVTSNYYLNWLNGGTNTFLQSYLGVASYRVDRDYTQMNGVTGDAIGDGMTLPLRFAFPSWARGDDAVPGSTATADFLSPGGSHAMIRNAMASGSKAVFMPERFDAISETDPDPNNARTLIHRIIEWVKPATVDVDEPSTRLLSGIGSVSPNPFRDATSISFGLSQAAAGPVRLEIFDLSGRIVAKVLDGVLAAGPHVREWNGRRDDGTPARSGVYFARLTTRGGVRNAKMVLLK